MPKPSLEVRIAISPRLSMMNAVKIIESSVRCFYPDALIRVSLGHQRGDTADANGVLPDDIQFRLIPRDEMEKWHGTGSPYLATAADRFSGPFVTSHCLVLDWDVICMRRFDELFDHRGLSGMMTHVAPMSQFDWVRLCHGFGLQISEWHEHSGWGIMGSPARHSPAGYFNSGMVFGPRAAFEAMQEPYFAAIAYLRRTISDAYWFDQLGLPLGIAAAELETHVLSQRWNFPNQPAFDQAFPDELADVRFLHFLRTDIVDRAKIFESQESIAAFVARTDLTGSNELLRKRIEELR